MLPWFTLLAALVSLVLIRIVVVTAVSYGLSRYALEMVVRVLVLELISPYCRHVRGAARWPCLQCGRRARGQRRGGRLARPLGAGAAALAPGPGAAGDRQLVCRQQPGHGQQCDRAGAGVRQCLRRVAVGAGRLYAHSWANLRSGGDDRLRAQDRILRPGGGGQIRRVGIAPNQLLSLQPVH